MAEGAESGRQLAATASEVGAAADAAVERAAEELRAQLTEATALIDPFPAFPGAVFAYGIEVEPRAGGLPELGCVILGDDGSLYELEIGLDATQQRVADASTERHEELVPLHLPPVLYVLYAHAALRAVADYLDASAEA